MIGIPDDLFFEYFFGTLVLFLDQFGTKKIGLAEMGMAFYRLIGLFRVY